MAKQQMILAAITTDSAIYYIVNPSDKANSGVVVQDSEVMYVPFWSYVDRLGASLNPATNNHFLRLLWKLGPEKDSSEWAAKFFARDSAFSEEDLDSIKLFLVDVPKERKKKPDLVTKSLDDLIEVKAPRSPLKMEPYDPDARDGDNDGIVQENTPWERPAATRLMDAAGNLIERGKESSSRPTGIRVVDANGNDVDYTPTYERSQTGTIGAGRQVGQSTSKPDAKPEPKKPVADKPTQEQPEVKPKKPGSGTALSDHGAGSLKERGLRDVRSAAAPPPPPEPKKPEPEKPDAPKPKKPKSRNVPYKKESYGQTSEPNENGILQEGTIWERPEGTDFVDANGRRFRLFENRTKRPVLIDLSTGERSDYVPTYERPDFVSPADLIEKRPLKEGDHPVMEFYEPGKGVKPEVIENSVQTSRASRTEQIGKQLDLLTNDELDKALKIYEVSDRAALVSKLLDLSDDKMIADLDAIREKPLHIAMPPSGLRAFLKSKRFKSQFEKPKKASVGRGVQGGYFNPEKRRGVEEELLGIPAGLPDELRPAYGFQMTKYEDDASMLPTTGFAADGYGAVVLRLKDSVRPRTTMSYGDSSDNKLPVIPVDGDVQRDAKIASFGRESNASDLGVLRELASAVDRDPDELTSGMYAGSPSYSEIQIHGGFSLDDVEEVRFYLGDYSESGVPIIDINGRPYIYVNEERVGNPDKIREDIVKALEQAGLSYEEDKK